MRRYSKVNIISTAVIIYAAVSYFVFLYLVPVNKEENRLNLPIQRSKVSLQRPYLDLAPSVVLHRKEIGLLEHAVRLNTSELNYCDVMSQTLSISQKYQSIRPHEYNLLIPKWMLSQRKSRYFLSAILRVRLYKDDKARWTMAELKQWIHYQLWAGVEHIYICNHYLNQEEKIVQDLKKYSEAGLVTVLDWIHMEAIPGSSDYHNKIIDNQIGCYNHVKDRWGNLSTWMYTFDMDENPYCPHDQCEGFLLRFLRRLDKGPDHDVSLIFLANFLLRGQGDRLRDVLYDRINRITPRPPNGLVKFIFKTNATKRALIHHAELRNGRTIYADVTKLKMLHYWGARLQNWGPDTKEMLDSTIEFNDVRETIGIAVRHSLLAFGEFDAFSNATGP